MERSIIELAMILINLNQETFDNQDGGMYRLGWPELRALAGVPKLTEEYLSDINTTLAESKYALIPFDDYLVVAKQGDFSCARKIPPRILEQNLPDEEELNFVVEGDEDE